MLTSDSSTSLRDVEEMFAERGLDVSYETVRRWFLKFGSTAGRTVPITSGAGARDQGDVWFFDKPVKNDLHPTMKPVALVDRAIRNSSKTRDIVLDPPNGSGSTLSFPPRYSITAKRLPLLLLLPRLAPLPPSKRIMRLCTG